MPLTWYLFSRVQGRTGYPSYYCLETGGPRPVLCSMSSLTREHSLPWAPQGSHGPPESQWEGFCLPKVSKSWRKLSSFLLLTGVLPSREHMMTGETLLVWKWP